MTTYILVHGGDKDGSIWDDVAAELRRKKHKVFCPSMTNIKHTSLQQNIDEICKLIKTENLNDIILAGHSYGAMVITGVLNQLPNKIQCLIYFDSVIPKSGKSLFGLLEEYGFNYQDHGLTADAPCIETIVFDEKLLQSKLKAYVLCLQSEFISATKPIYNEMLTYAGKYNWLYFNLDTKHACMLTQPNECAVILEGMNLFLNQKK